MKATFLMVIAAICVGVGIFAYWHVHEALAPVASSATSSVPVAHCDNDAKICPDGSTVLRTGSQCEFAACPSMFGEVRDWQNRKDPKSDVTFKYPAELGSPYVTAREWPPTIIASKDPFTCQLSEGTKAMSGLTTSEELFNNETYCVWRQDEGAAGSTYSEYHITFTKNNTHFTMQFTVQFPQCMNYDGTEQSACQAAQKSFNVLELVSGMEATISQ